MEQALEELQDKLWDLDKVCHCFQKTSINHIFAIVFKKKTCIFFSVLGEQPCFLRNQHYEGRGTQPRPYHWQGD